MPIAESKSLHLACHTGVERDEYSPDIGSAEEIMRGEGSRIEDPHQALLPEVSCIVVVRVTVKGSSVWGSCYYIRDSHSAYYGVRSTVRM